jgi:hypothetical protein
MTVGSLPDLITALARSEIETILGTAEANWLDFKRAPYALNEDKSKWELAKDVSAFANVGAGVILIGIETELDTVHRVEKAAKRRPTTAEAAKIQSIRSVVGDWIYPRVRDFDVSWYGDDEQQGLGYLLLYIPAQAETDRPFVLRRMADGEEKGSIGIAERDGADTVWWPAERIHHQVQERVAAQPVEPAPANRIGRSPAPDDRLSEHIQRNEAAEGWDNAPVLHLQAVPPRQGQTLPNFYNRNGLRGALKDPEQLRQGGWNLRSPYEPEVDEGALVCRSPGYDLLRLDPDGLFTVTGIADTGFLCWGMDGGRFEDEPLSLNPTAIVEWVYNFFLFVNFELKVYVRGQWTYQLAAMRFKTANIGLIPGPPKQIGYIPTPTRASSDRWIKRFPEDATAREILGLGELSTGHEAFDALDHLYGLFGLGNDEIPFTSDDEVVVSADELNRL